jgi:hypothetical protein
MYRPASTEGTRPDVGSRLADAYRHGVMPHCRLSMDFDKKHQEALWRILEGGSTSLGCMPG